MGTPSTLAIWGLGADMALMASILLFIFRVLRNPTNPKGLRQLGELEGTIRSLIREAEGAGKALNDQLIRRQEGLEKLLFDLESAEKRIHRIQSRAEETRGGVDVAMAKVQKALDALNSALTRFQTKELQIRYLSERGDASRGTSFSRGDFETAASDDRVNPHSPDPLFSTSTLSAPLVRTSGVEMASQRVGSTDFSKHSVPENRTFHTTRSTDWYEAPDDVGRQEVEELRGAGRENGTIYGNQIQEQLQKAPSMIGSASIGSISNQPGDPHARAPLNSTIERFATSPINRPELNSSINQEQESIHAQVRVDRPQSRPRVTRETLLKAQSLLAKGTPVDEVSRITGLIDDQVRLLLALGQTRSRSSFQTMTQIENPASREPRLPRQATKIDPRLGVLGNSRRPQPERGGNG